jgi:2,3-bisphosphoglycerate-independent phosphoglycerate mutase
MKKQPFLALIILDGFGNNPRKEGNAIKLAKTPVISLLRETYPETALFSSSFEVGLPEGVMGNSEVGHMNLGAGRVVYQDITRIDKAIKEGTFFTNVALLGIIDHVKKNKSNLHLMGLVSDGGVHSVDRHYFALIELAKKNGIQQDSVFFHAFTDGRDTPPTSGYSYLGTLVKKMNDVGVGRLVSVMGRYYAMDRDKRWDRTALAYNALVNGEGNTTTTLLNAVKESYAKGETDEFIKPIILANNSNQPVGRILEGDGIIFFNFRADRGRQLTRVFTSKEFNDFDRKRLPSIYFVTMTQYHESFTNVPVAFHPSYLKGILPEILSGHGLNQIRIAETEKYAHVTYFFNGGDEKAYKGEERVLIPSPKVATYDLMPEMSAFQVAQTAVARIKSGAYDVMILNFANPDMVGHTGNLEAAVKAVETVDKCIGNILKAVGEMSGVAIVTADHGNCEQMIDYETKSPHTYHTTFPVPLILVADDFKGKKLRQSGALCDVAPTMLEILGISSSSILEGKSLLTI